MWKRESSEKLGNYIHVHKTSFIIIIPDKLHGIGCCPWWWSQQRSARISNWEDQFEDSILFFCHLEVTFVYCFQNLLSSWWYTVFSSILKGNDIKVFLFCGLFVIHNKSWWVLSAHLEQFACSHTISHTNAAWSALSAVAGLHQKRGHDMQLHPK